MLLFTVALFRANSDHSKSSDYESEATEVHTFSSFWDSFFSGSKDSNTVTGTNGIEELAKPVPACTMNEEEQAAMISSLKAKQVGSPLVMVDQGMVDFKAKVGRATWVLLHSIAAKYSETPTEQQREHLLALFAVLPKVYPCDECARDMSGLLRQDPPVVRTALLIPFEFFFHHYIYVR